MQKNRTHMLGNSPDQSQTDLFKSLPSSQPNPKHPLYVLAHVILWKQLEERFAPLYGRVGLPSHPVIKMATLLILQYIQNLSDERVTATWQENSYDSYFVGGATPPQ